MIDVAILKAMAAAGATADMIIAAVEADQRIEAEAAPQRSAAAERQARYRERNKALRDITRDVTCDTKEIPPTPPKENTSSLSSSEDSLNLKEGSEEPACGRDGWVFDEFWKLYPHKVGKGAARRRFESIRKAKIVDFTELIAGLLRYAAKTDDRPWCNPATWLNEHRWTDQPAPEVLPRDRRSENSLLAAFDRIKPGLGARGVDYKPVPGPVLRISSG